jgi:WD40 repeat protein
MIWNLTTLQMMATRSSHTLWVDAIDVSPDLTLMATGGADDGTVMIWDLRSGQAIFTLEGHQQVGNRAATIFYVAFSGGGTRLMSAANDGSIIEWEVGSDQPIRTLGGFFNAIKSLAWSPDGHYLATGGLEGMVHVWDVGSQSVIFNARAGKNLVRRMTWSPDGAILAAVAGETVTLWNSTTGEMIHQLVYSVETDDSAVMPGIGKTEGASHVFWGVAFSPDGTLLAAGDEDGLVTVWDVAAGEQLYALAGHPHIVSYVRFLSDGTLVSASQDGTVITWNLGTSEQVNLEQFPGAATLVISPDEQIMAIGRSDASLSVREVGSPLSVTVLDGSSDLMIRPDFSGDSTLCSTGLDDDMLTVGIFDASTGELLHTYRSHNQAVLDAAISPDGSTLATASEDGTVLLWAIGAGFSRVSR